MKKFLAAAIALAMPFLMLTGCSGTQTKSIHVSVPETASGWIKSTIQYAKEKAEELNATGKYKVTVETATDSATQQKQIDALLSGKAKPDGIVILPADSQLETSVQKIADAGVPFVMYDRILENTALQEAAKANVKGDNEGIGTKTAERFFKDGLKQGDSIYVMEANNASVAELRTKGFVEALTAKGWTEADMKNVTFSPTVDMDGADAKVEFTSWLNGMSIEEISKYRYIYSHDDELVLGILEALAGTEIEEAKCDAFYNSVEALGSVSGLGKVFDILKGTPSNPAYTEIVKEFDFFTATYDPAMIKQAMQDMADSLSGKAPEKQHIIPTDLVDASNVQNFKGF